MKARPAPAGNILLIWDRIGDYHAARFRALEECTGPGRVFISDLGAADQLYQWKNPLHEHPGYQPLSLKPVEEKDQKYRLRNFKNLVEKHNIQTVGIAGYGRTEYRSMLLWCARKGIRVVLFAESWYPGKLDLLKGWFLKLVCQRFLVSGLRAKQHFVQRLGLSEDRILLPYSVVDNRHFEHAIPDYAGKKLLCVARFSPEKNLENLLLAFANSGLGALGWQLELVGGGPQKEKLQQTAPSGVLFRDWVSYEELPALYSSASGFILPSSFEPWGLVVNEAMAAGLPVAVSRECGCAPDLVANSDFQFSAGNVEEMAGVLLRMTTMSSEEKQQTGRMNRLKIEAFSPAAWAKAFLQLAQTSKKAKV